MAITMPLLICVYIVYCVSIRIDTYQLIINNKTIQRQTLYDIRLLLKCEPFKNGWVLLFALLFLLYENYSYFAEYRQYVCDVRTHTRTHIIINSKIEPKKKRSLFVTHYGNTCL